MKKLILSFLLVFILTPLAYAQNTNKLNECFSRMSCIQSYLEFYYMSTGDYPKNLTELDLIFNSDVKKDSDRVKFPLDPLSAKPFIYKVSDDMKSYTLSAPEPNLYNMDKIELSSVNWGWMDEIARRISFAAKTDLCSKYMSGLVMAAKSFQEKEKKLPSDINELIPVYVKSLPLCPKCGKPYTIELKKDDLLVSCPEPSVHGCSIFQYSLKKGFVTKKL